MARFDKSLEYKTLATLYLPLHKAIKTPNELSYDIKLSRAFACYGIKIIHEQKMGLFMHQNYIIDKESTVNRGLSKARLLEWPKKCSSRFYTPKSQMPYIAP